MNKKLLVILILILASCAVALTIIIIVRKHSTNSYTEYTKETVNNTEEFLDQSDVVQAIKLAKDREDVTDQILSNDFPESMWTRKDILYAVYMFTNKSYTDLEEHYYNVVSNEISDTFTSDDQQYIMLFKYGGEKYIAMKIPMSDYVSILKYKAS